MTSLSDETFLHILDQLQSKQNDQELHWYISHVVIPDIPQVIETLTICLNLLVCNSPQLPNTQQHTEKGPSIKLPVSSSKSELLKGIIVRDGPYITQMNVSINESSVNKHLSKLTLKKPILLDQILICQNSIENSINLLTKVYQEYTDSDCTYHHSLIEKFKSLLSDIQISKNNLQLPTDPNLVFPINVTDTSSFEPNLPSTVSIDFYISQAEICLDLKTLHKINEKPWSEVDSNGKSYVDKLRDEMKLPTSSASSFKEPPLTRDTLEKKLEDKIVEKNHNSFFNNVLQSLRHKHDPMDYITRCITYNDMVVMINSKIEVSTEDPVLVSCFTKLDSIDYLISEYLNNINKLITA